MTLAGDRLAIEATIAALEAAAYGDKPTVMTDPLVELILAATYEPNTTTHPERRAERVAAALRANPEVVRASYELTDADRWTVDELTKDIEASNRAEIIEIHKTQLVSLAARRYRLENELQGILRAQSMRALAIRNLEA